MDTRSWVEQSTILKVEVGSGVHGIAQKGHDDTDEMGVCLEPLSKAFGLVETFEQHIVRTAAIREGRHDAPSEPGDLDLTVYSLRKWVRLALKGNPTVLLLLFSPTVRQIDARGSQLRDMAPQFASKKAGSSFLGYLQAQRMRLLGERGQKNVNRRDLVEKFGFDTKYASHMVRLGYQGIEYMTTGAISLPMRPDELATTVAIRRGEMPLNDILTLTGNLELELRDLCQSSPLPDYPNTDAIEAWMTNIYLEHWKCQKFDRFLEATR